MTFLPFKKLSLVFFLTAVLIYAAKLALTQCGANPLRICSHISSEATISGLQKEIEILNDRLKREKKLITDVACQLEENLNNQSNPKINRPLWELGDVQALSGCWNLEWDYELVNIKTDEIVGVSSWTICFEEGMNTGHQHLIFDDNIQCTDAKIEGKFSTLDKSTKLNLDDITDVICDNNWVIFRRQLQCELLDADTSAVCSSRQLRDGSWTEFGGPNVLLKKRAY